jgi:nitroimidazol reductase NimA-like FMN-containing flavoprotein (pyridoxamine 5'-phosphate oxidase superfamily)
MTAARKDRSSSPLAERPHMPGYGLPRSKKGLLSWTWALERLRRSRQYWIATTRPDGRPHVMVVWALWLDGALYFSTGSQSRKARNLALNPHCTMCTERADEAVVLEGRVERERDVDRIRNFLRLYEQKYQWDMSGMAEDLLKLKEPVFRLRPQVVFGLNEKTFQTSATRWRFDRAGRGRKA